MAKKKKHKPDPEHWKFKRGRTQKGHIDNCSSGYTQTSKNRFRQVHHIVPVSSCSDATISKYVTAAKLKLLHNCMAETDWKIDGTDNVISLPLKPVYLDKRAPVGWDKLPCHQVEHNPAYTDAVSDYLKDNVWNKVQKQAKSCELDPEDLQKKMEDASDHWRDFLTNRGKEHGGTKKCWDKQMSLPDTWYIPFSMNPGTPTPRAPVKWDDLSGSIKQKLAQLFQLH